MINNAFNLQQKVLESNTFHGIYTPKKKKAASGGFFQITAD